MKETLLPYAPAILVLAIAVILRLTFAKKRKSADRTANCTMISPPPKVEKTPNRQYLERFWEDDI